eukprot:scaffold16002_cov92-Isochrysis_galbana.AAC.2
MGTRCASSCADPLAAGEATGAASCNCMRVLMVKTGCMMSETTTPDAVADVTYTKLGDHRCSGGARSARAVSRTFNPLYRNMYMAQERVEPTTLGPTPWYSPAAPSSRTIDRNACHRLA